MSQVRLAERLRRLDSMLAVAHARNGDPFRLRREGDYSSIAGRYLDMLGQRR
jgi:hypothetical protein